ncbi:MAG: RodZ domain-containing protein [Burkholderiales bacterium]
MTEGAADENRKVSAGGALAAARQQLGLSVADVARQLKLAVRQVEALEADDFKNLPRITFVRGFIRNYAKLVQIDSAPLLIATESMLPAPQIPQAERGVAEIPMASGRKQDWKTYIISAVLALLLVGFFAFEWYHGKPEKAAVPKPGKPAAAQPENARREPVPAQRNETAPAPKPVVEPAPLPPDLAQSPVSLAPPEVKAAAPRSRELRMEFLQDSWVEISDRNGRIIFSQVSPAGSTETVRGTPPLSVVVGNAAGVNLTYNNKSVDLKPHTKVDVARLTLE